MESGRFEYANYIFNLFVDDSSGVSERFLLALLKFFFTTIHIMKKVQYNIFLPSRILHYYFFFSRNLRMTRTYN